MRNRPFAIPPAKSDKLTGFPETGTLKNRFSGRILFRNNLYHLETGNLSVLDKVRNNWFLDEVVNYARTRNDHNLIPALKRIADGTAYSESIRQHASETIEILQEQPPDGRGKVTGTIADHESVKAEAARKMIAGIRYPQTTDILRLLREKSPELKRLALFLIGKFNLTDMVQEVCECLNTPEIEIDAYLVLVSFGNSVADDLNRFYLISSGNINLSRVILRIYSKICPKENMSFIVERISSNSRQLKETALKALIGCGYKADAGDIDHFNKTITDTFSLLTRLTSGKVCLLKQKDLFLYREIDKEYNRWKEYLLGLLHISYGSAVTVPDRKNHFEKEGNNYRYLPELAAIFFEDFITTKTKSLPDEDIEKRRLKRLNRFFPGEIPVYEDLVEDIINSDYNTIGIWTKACAIRNIPSIKDQNTRESVAALLFSPVEILRQEAARLISRSDVEMYNNIAGRIPGQIRKSLDVIITGELAENELLFEKVKFLTTCFPGIYEEGLVFLAENLVFSRKTLTEIFADHKETISWSFRNDATIADVNISIGSTGLSGKTNEKSTPYLFSYILPLNVVEGFTFHFPENAAQIMKYIDDNEELLKVYGFS